MSEVNFHKYGKTIYAALEQVENEIAKGGIDPVLHHLLMLRASQINQCNFCVNMHTADARNADETDERLDHLVVWRKAAYYTAQEKAALAWLEALTVLRENANLEALKADLCDHFTSEQIATLTAISAMINLWNRIQVSQH